MNQKGKTSTRYAGYELFFLKKTSKTVILSAAIAGILFERVIALNLLHSFAKKAGKTMCELADAPFIDNIADDDADSDEESD